MLLWLVWRTKSHPKSVKICKITTDKNVIKYMQKNYELTTQNFHYRTQSYFDIVENITASLVAKTTLCQSDESSILKQYLRKLLLSNS